MFRLYNARAMGAILGENVKRKVLISILILVVAAFAAMLLTACGEQGDYSAQLKVVYELEGGVYQNTSLPVTLYFPYAEGESGTIVDPMTLSGKEFEKAGYVLEGWYRVKNGTDEDATYDGQWHFDTDVAAGGDTLTLFAKWKPAVEYTYNVVYRDETTGNVVNLGSYPVAEGDVFEDYLGYATRRAGYTKLGFVDAEGNPWDAAFTHPGGASSVAVDVFVDYIEGNYTLVSTAADFSSALGRNRNIYLLTDVDYAGAKLKSAARYTGVIEGNGHTVGGFVLDYDASVVVADYEDDSAQSLYVSLLGDAKGATVRHLSLEGKVTLASTYSRMSGTIYFAPLATVCEGSRFDQVSATYVYAVGALRAGLSESDLVIVADRLSYQMDGASTEADCSVNITKQGE